MLVLNDFADRDRSNLAITFFDSDATPTGTGERCQLNAIDFPQDVASTVDWVLERNLTLVTLVVEIYHSGLSLKKLKTQHPNYTKRYATVKGKTRIRTIFSRLALACYGCSQAGI
tara:strand:- start:329 stop:673 length:345 start_codon:yes stop_codon:yes gene_type:complete